MPSKLIPLVGLAIAPAVTEAALATAPTRPKWNESHNGKTWEDMPAEGGCKIGKKLAFALYRMGEYDPEGGETRKSFERGIARAKARRARIAANRGAAYEPLAGYGDLVDRHYSAPALSDPDDYENQQDSFAE